MLVFTKFSVDWIGRGHCKAAARNRRYTTAVVHYHMFGLYKHKLSYKLVGSILNGRKLGVLCDLVCRMMISIFLGKCIIA
jgi:hypothetical protein